jgi:hypothetical protein
LDTKIYSFKLQASSLKLPLSTLAVLIYTIMITRLLQVPPAELIAREDHRVPCRVCGHIVFLEQLRARRDAIGTKDAADRERCERCGWSRAV